MTDLTRDYLRKENDPALWLRSAKGFMLSSRAIWDNLFPLFGPTGLADQNINRFLAYWQSFLLLTAFAFENLYRGVLAATGKSWRDALSSKGGHALVKHITSITTLDADEANLVERLETYLIWAGRYVVPKEAAMYNDAIRDFRISIMGSDLATAERLFARIEQKFSEKSDVSHLKR